MGLLARLFGKRGGPPPQAQPEETITVYDEYGRELRIDRDTWRKEVLPAHLRARWSSPDELYSAIVMALNDGLAADVLDAAEHLTGIDPNPERAACLHAVVLMANKRIRRAERVLRDALQSHPRSAALLTNLAKVHAERGDERQSHEVLWQALTADPNFENAVEWYGAIHHERGGREAWRAAMERIASLDGAWRARLWIAHDLLEQKNLPAALELYEQVLVMAAGDRDALVQISGDLGRAGHADELLERVYPFYDSRSHNPVAGFNFLQAFVETGDWQRGEELLHELMLLDLAPYRERLMGYSARFAEMKQQPPAIEPIADREIEIELIQLDQPVWMTALQGASSWLFANDSSGPEIAVVAFANTTDRAGLLRDDETLLHSEDDLGRLTRAIPLHLSDVLRFRTGAPPVTLLPVAGGAMVVAGRESGVEDLRTMSGGRPLAITGSVSMHHDELQVEVAVWKTSDERPLARFTERAQPEHLPIIWAAIEAALLQLLAFENLAVLRDEDERLRIPPQLFRSYLDGLGQAYALALAAMGAGSGLFGERNIHRWLLGLALELPANPIPAIALVSALSNTRRRGSELYREIEKETLKLFADAPPAQPELRRLSPFVFRLFDRTKDFDRSRGEQMHGASDEYLHWLAAIETAFA